MKERHNLNYINAKQLANKLNCGVSTIWRHTKNGLLPEPMRLGGMTRWCEQEIDQLIQSSLKEREGTASSDNFEPSEQHVH